MSVKIFTRLMCIVLAVLLITSSSVLAVNTSNFVDFPNDWSTPAMEYAVENGLIKGYEDNTIRADKNITRAEMATIINRAFGSFVEATKFPYLDVKDIEWFYSDMKKAANMGTMQGDGSYLRPDEAITREEAFVVLARAYSQKDSDFSVLDQYYDNADINNWSKDYLSFLTRNNYVNGFADGNLYPQANLTRAELSQLLFNILAEYISSQSALDAKDTYDGNIVINGAITEISGKTFNGDLVIGDGVGTNKIVIKDTKIAGALIIRGATQVEIINSTVGTRIIVNNPNNNVHFNNYRNEKVFANIEVQTQTSATWNTPSGGGSSGGSSGGDETVYNTVTFYKGTEATEENKKAEIKVEYNTAINASQIPVPRKEKGYWKDSSVSSVYAGEEYEHEIEFLWYEKKGGKFVLFDETQPITEDKNVFNISKYADIRFIKGNEEIDVKPRAYYTENVPIYESMLDVIFGYEAPAGKYLDASQSKVLKPLINKGIIDENYNILNQSVFLKFSLVGKERLEKFAYKNVEYELIGDATHDSMLSYLDHLINKNDGSAEIFLRKLINSLLTGAGKDEIKSVLEDILTDMLVDIETEFEQYVKTYLENNQSEYEDLIRECLGNGVTITEQIKQERLNEVITYIWNNKKQEVIPTVVNFVLSNDEDIDDVIDTAINEIVNDKTFREDTIEDVADYLEHHPDVMDEVLEFAKESELGAFVDEFIAELLNKNKFKVHPENLFIAESIKSALVKYDYDGFMDEYIPERFAGLIPDSVLKPIYNNALEGFKSQIERAIVEANKGNTAYVDCGVTVKFNPMKDFVIPVFDKYLELKDKAEDKLGNNNGTPGDIYDFGYDNNKYTKALVDLIKIENLFNKSQENETLSGYSLKDFSDYYNIMRNASVLISDAGKWYIENLPEDKAEKAQEKLAQKIAEYFNSILALVNTYSQTKQLPSYKDVLKIFEDDIPDRFLDKYESALGKVEAKVDIDDKIEAVYNKLAEKGIVSKFNTVIDKFVASKFNREITEEQISLIYTTIKKCLSDKDFYTIDDAFDIMNEKLEEFKVNEDEFQFAVPKSDLKIKIKRVYR